MESTEAEIVGVISVPARGLRLRDAERELLRITLGLTSGNQSWAAEMLDISRPTMLRKLRAYGIATVKYPPQRRRR